LQNSFKKKEKRAKIEKTQLLMNKKSNIHYPIEKRKDIRIIIIIVVKNTTTTNNGLVEKE
jgi:hypothetical protein